MNIATDPAPAVEISHLVKQFPRQQGDKEQKRAIDDVSFDVPQGSFFTLLGPSGCGKTTTLRCMAGLETADGGEIRMAGTPVYSAATKTNVKPERRPIAMVPQSYGIWPHMTVMDNAAFPLRHGRLNVPRSEVKDRTLAILDQVGLLEFADRWSTQLSGGQQQRLALARALLCEPEVLLLDEPLSNLDAKLRSALRSELRSFQQRFGVTTIYVTHDQGEALAMSDYIVVMSRGRLEQFGTPTEIYEEPASRFVADFVGSANLIEGEADPIGATPYTVSTPLGGIRCERSGSVSADVGGGLQAATVCVRPEHVLVQSVERGASAEGANVFEGTVLSAEYLGDRKELEIELGAGIRVRAQADAHLGVWEGDRVQVQFDPSWTIVLWS